MYPTIRHELMTARAADLHRQAERDRIAQAAVHAVPATTAGTRPPG